MRGLTITKHATLSLNAEDWELYTDYPQAMTAAMVINGAIEEKFNSGATRTETAASALEAMRENEIYGAMDSEPIRKLDEIMDALYNPRHNPNREWGW